MIQVSSPAGHSFVLRRLEDQSCVHVLPSFLSSFRRHLQIHQKVTQGLIQLYRLAGPGAPMTDVVGAASVCCEAWAAERLSPAALWDAMQLVVLGQTWMNSAALTAGCKDLAETLEKRFFAAQNGKKLPLDVPSHTWRMLRAAVTVRRAALPMLPAGPAQAEWAALLDQNELLLLQRRLHQILAAPLGEGATVEQQRLTRLLAADCVVVNVNHPCLMEELVPLATKAYRDCNETPPGAANDFAVPPRPITAKATGADAPACAMQGPGAAAALSAVMRPDMQLPRCPASLQVSLGGWVCRCCKRAYEVLPEGVEGERGSGLECLLCGGLVGVSLPEFLVTPPCM